MKPSKKLTDNMKISIEAKVGVIGIVTLLVLGIVISSPVVASSGTMYIYADTTLSEDHHGNIEIMADDVTLDCGGHSVIGSGSGNGIQLNRL